MRFALLHATWSVYSVNVPVCVCVCVQCKCANVCVCVQCKCASVCVSVCVCRALSAHMYGVLILCICVRIVCGVDVYVTQHISVHRK